MPKPNKDDKNQDTNTDDRGDNLTAEEQAEVERLQAEAEDKGEEVSDDEIAAAVAAMRGEKPDAKDGNDDDDGDDGKGKGKKNGKEGNMVPQSRFDEAISQMREQNEALQAQIAELSKGSKEPKVNPLEKMQTDLEAARDAWEDALLDGDKNKAREARKIVTTLEGNLQQATLAAASDHARTASSTDIRYDNLLATLEETFPIINPESDTYDKATMQRMARVSNALQNDGTPADKALQEAADLVLGKPEKEDSTKVDENLRNRDESQRRAAARAVANQGPDFDKVNTPRGKVDPVLKPSKLSDRQLEKLPDDVQSQLRGDQLTPEQMEK
jgi:hypothetical protein